MGKRDELKKNGKKCKERILDRPNILTNVITNEDCGW